MTKLKNQNHKSYPEVLGQEESFFFVPPTTNWCVAECGREEHRTKKNDLVPNKDWPQDLQGIIDFCSVDESHYIKRADSETSVAIQWLAAEAEYGYPNDRSHRSLACLSEVYQAP